jgi:hypothetical protein
METARSLRHVITRAVGPASSTRRELSAGTVRTQAMRGILLPSLVLAALGTATAVSPGHVSSGHVHSGVVLTRSCKVDGSRPWMFTVPTRTRPWSYGGGAALSGPWMFTVIGTKPWMFTPTTSSWLSYGAHALSGPWMFAVTGKMPWMFTVTTKKPAKYTSSDSLRAKAACLAGGAPA